VIATIRNIFRRPVDDDVKRFYITSHRCFGIDFLTSFLIFTFNSFHASIMKPIAAIARHRIPVWGGVAVRRLDVQLGQCGGQSSFATSNLRAAMPAKKEHEDCTSPGEGDA
jgi:hypothetical protein